MTNKRIILTTEWNIPHGGAENVNVALAEIFVNNIEIRSIWNENGYLTPNRQSLIRFLKFLPRGIQGLLSLPYHLIGVPKGTFLLVSSSFMFAHLSRTRSGGRHFIYVHTPIRYIWNPEIDKRAKKFGFLFRIVSIFLKKIEFRMLDRNAVFVANSAEVQKRIQKYWDARAEIIHPPVDVEFYSRYLKQMKPTNIRLISAGRFVPYKNHDLAIQLAHNMRIPLILAGSGPQESDLRNLALELGANVQFEIGPSREKLAEMISSSSVYLHLAHEDFGILPVEAMASGTPVLGFAIGGLLESVNESNGCLVENFNELRNGVAMCLQLDRQIVSNSVQKFSRHEFNRRIATRLIEEWPDLQTFIKKEYLNG